MAGIPSNFINFLELRIAPESEIDPSLYVVLQGPGETVIVEMSSLKHYIGPPASYTIAGIVKLSDDTNTLNSSVAATSTAVKTLNDAIVNLSNRVSSLESNKYDKTGGEISGEARAAVLKSRATVQAQGDIVAFDSSAAPQMPNTRKVLGQTAINEMTTLEMIEAMAKKYVELETKLRSKRVLG